MTTPLDPVVVRAVGQDAANVPVAVVGLDLASDRREAAEHLSGIGQEIASSRARRRSAKRPADVGGDDAETAISPPA